MGHGRPKTALAASESHVVLIHMKGLRTARPVDAAAAPRLALPIGLALESKMVTSEFQRAKRGERREGPVPAVL